MKKAIASTLAAIFLLSAILFFPLATVAAVPANVCWDNWETCRVRAFQADMGVIRTTVALTVCDVGLGKCLLTV
jgi:hypothetical protein